MAFLCAGNELKLLLEPPVGWGSVSVGTRAVVASCPRGSDCQAVTKNGHRDAPSAQRLELLEASADAQGNLDPYISFHLTNFVASKKRAEAAVSGSHEEIMSLFDDPENIAPAHLRSLLPIPYSVLNPARIPEILAQFDTSGLLISVHTAHCHSLLIGYT
ncbi:hypothetical protein C8R45DRAFT_1106083 [Mycena sanguinolenta]|nr:hypothetical protein C8R45DRAFT_1106083 [Mycena sanguinolenta]